MNMKNFIVAIVLVCALYFGFSAHFSKLCAEEVSKEEESLFVAQKAFDDAFYDVSLGLLERFKKNYPNSKHVFEVSFLIGQCYYQQNRYLEALNLFEGLLNQKSDRSRQDAILYWIAEVHFRGNNYLKAASYYKRIIEEFPLSTYLPSAYYSTGWCLFQDHAFKDALVYFQSVGEKFPKEQLAQDSAFKAVECLYNMREYTSLVSAAQAYPKSYPKDVFREPFICFYGAEGQYYGDNFAEALKGYESVLALTKDEKLIALSKLGMGWSNLKLKRYAQAQSVFHEINGENLEKPAQGVLLLGKAILTAQDKNFNEARRLYDELLAQAADPLVVIQAYLGKAEALYNSASFKEAKVVYLDALAKVQGEVSSEITDKLHYGLAWVYLKDGQFKEAIEEFQKIAKGSDDKTVKISALCQIGDTYQDSGDFAKAIETYEIVLKEYQDNFYSDYVQYQLGVSMLKSGNYDGAILAFGNLKARYPESKLLDDAAYALGLSYLQRENYEASRDIFARFRDEYKESSLKAQAAYLLGTSLFNLAKYGEAIEAFKDVIRLFGQDTEMVQKAEYEIADCFSQMGNEKEAMSRFKMLRTKYPDSTLTPEIVWWLGEYYYRHNDQSLARRYFQSLIQDFSKSDLVPNAYYALASTFGQEGKFDEAVENFKKVIEVGKSDLAAQAAIAIADIYVKQDKVEQALSTYKDVAVKFSNLADLVYPKIADIYRDINSYDEALEYYRKSLDIVPVSQTGLMQLKIGEVLQAQGKIDQAIEEYLKVAYFYAENNALAVKAFLRVAAIYEDKNNYKEALVMYKRVLEKNVEEGAFAQERIDWIRNNTKVK